MTVARRRRRDVVLETCTELRARVAEMLLADVRNFVEEDRLRAAFCFAAAPRDLDGLFVFATRLRRPLHVPRLERQADVAARARRAEARARRLDRECPGQPLRDVSMTRLQVVLAAQIVERVAHRGGGRPPRVRIALE